MTPFYQKSYILKSYKLLKNTDNHAFTCSIIDELNINDGEKFNSSSTIERFYDFIKMNQKGYYVYNQNKECVFRAWIFNTKERALLKEGFIYNLNQKESFIAWCETDIEHRRKGAFEYWLKFIIPSWNQDLKTYVDPKNKSSLKAFYKCGFQIDDIFHHFTFYKLKCTFRTRSKGKTNFKLIFGSTIR